MYYEQHTLHSSRFNDRRGFGGQDGLELDAEAHRSWLLREEAESSQEVGRGRHFLSFSAAAAISAASLSEVGPSRSLSAEFLFLMRPLSELGLISTQKSLSWNARKVSNNVRGLLERGASQIRELARASGVGFGSPRED